MPPVLFPVQAISHFAGVAGDAAVGEEVGRVGEDEVDGIFWDGGEDVEAIALVEAEMVLGVVEGRSGERRTRIPTLKNRGWGTRVAVGRIGDGFGHWCSTGTTDSQKWLSH
jgi:hypothetical protein